MRLKSVILVVGGLLWVFVVVIGMKAVWDYARSPGPAATPPVYWPVPSKVVPDSNRPTLIMFAHPHCPCSRASLRELELIIAQSQGQSSAYVLLYRPAGLDESWTDTDLVESAREIPGVKVLLDEDGVEAHRFNVTTSGQVILYDSNGWLAFNGGITGSRGHSGDNAGRSAILSLLTEGNTSRTESPVFGCPIFDDTSQCHKGVE